MIRGFNKCNKKLKIKTINIFFVLQYTRSQELGRSVHLVY